MRKSGKLNRGGHDPYKVYAAYQRGGFQRTKDQPHGHSGRNDHPKVMARGTGQGQNPRTTRKRSYRESLKKFRDRIRYSGQ